MKRRELFTTLGQPAGACCKPGASRMAALIPNAVFRTQDDRRVRFYDDLIKGRQVMVLMMYASCETYCPLATQRMVELHHQVLAPRMGKDLFLVNVSLKPEQDDPAALRAYAEMHHALLPGWTFLTGDRYDVDTLRYRFFSHDHIGIDEDVEQHAGLLKIVNDPVGRWFHADLFASTRTVLEHIQWSDPPKTLKARLRDNRKLQEKIDRDRALYGFRKIA
ncbi:MAG TPA: SCO family protein [Steroidobacteraceae bacterium]|jgi:protein SCO1/2|nr:SCO family protein [Steroidobacteraceae bacterium]